MEDPFDALDAPQPKPRQKDGLVDDQETFSLTRLKGLLRDDGLKTGYVLLTDDFWPRAKYEVCKGSDGTVTLKIWREATKNSAKFFQEVVLDGRRVTFGLRPYLTCPACGSLRLKLQFTPLGRLACRSCLNLAYQSSRENHSKPIFRLFRRHWKLKMMQADVRRIDYAGRMTRKARSAVRMANKWLPEGSVDDGGKLEYSR